MERQRGQISILIVFSLIPMFTLFAFVVNVGMLVNAKIALQNAADLAAYAGAATQARQLTHISHLNYMMRQAYKKFIFKYYVMGNLSLKCFPRGGTPDPSCKNVPPNDPNFHWLNPGGSSGIKFPGMPVVCVSLSQESNPCQLGQPVPVVTPPSCIPLDPTCQSLADAAAAISAIQLRACDVNSAINAEVLTHWLYTPIYDSQMQSNVNLAGLIDNMGLVPQELLLRSRIETVRGYINARAAQHVTPSALKSRYEGSAELSGAERTILAFKTALGNLNPNVFTDPESVEMTELMPSGADLLEPLTEIKPTFDAGFVVMANPNTGSGTPGSPPNCNIGIEFVKASPIVGVYRSGNSLVYYAVKLRARARLLFNPFPFGNPDDGVDLVAYAAAAPFGSRIGPKLPESDFLVPGNAWDGKQSIPVHYPGLKVSDSMTWENAELLGAYYNLLAPLAQSAVGTGAIGKSNLTIGDNAATLPDAIEVGQYNIPVNTETGPTKILPYYDTSGGPSSTTNDYTFWAPIIPVNGKDAFTDQMKTELSNIIDNSTFVTDQPVQKTKQALLTVLLGQLDGALGDLRTRQNFNVARMPDPLSWSFFKGTPPNIVSLKALDVTKLATSFTTDHEGQLYDNGRDGYSVKLIPFRRILGAPGQLSPSGNWQPITDSLGGERAELLKVAH